MRKESEGACMRAGKERAFIWNNFETGIEKITRRCGSCIDRNTPMHTRHVCQCVRACARVCASVRACVCVVYSVKRLIDK